MKNLTLALFAIIWASQLTAVDRIVEEFGQPPAFSSITAAVNAAQDGDRIIIKNRAGNIPWIENITINKSLQFLSFANDDFFVVQGTYTVQFIQGLEVDIVGMRNTNGSVVQGSAASGNRAAKVRVLDSWFQNGGVSLSSNFFDTDIVGCKIENGFVRFAIGNLIGNEITGTGSGSAALNSSLVFISNSTNTFLGDTCLIIGNRITFTTSASTDFALRIRNDQQVVHVKNNFVKYTTRGLDITGGIAQPITNQIWNNTFYGLSSFATSTSHAIRMFSTSENSIWEVMSNACIRGTLSMSVTRGIEISSPGGQANCYYNHISSGYSTAIAGAWTFEDLNLTNQTIEIDTEDGSFTNAPNAIDGGNPAPLFFDLDLTQNDAGCYGGSFTQDNFFPLHTGAARVYNVVYPFNVRVGNTMNVKAFSFDR